VTPASVTRSERRRVAGLATRTTNADEAQPAKARIPGLWGQFITQTWAERLEQAGAFGPTLAVYSAYESDVTGSYQILLGREVAGSSHVAAPLQVGDISPGQYLVFSCSGPLPGAVIEGWRAVWAFFERSASPRRAYTADFEAYREPERVEIWVAVRDAGAV
jgi:predicted transcriptional regulator YdeE